MDERTRRKLQDEGIENSVKGKTRDIKGRVKDAAGGLTGDTSLQVEGKLDRAKGAIQDKAGEVQRRIADSDRDEEL